MTVNVAKTAKATQTTKATKAKSAKVPKIGGVKTHPSCVVIPSKSTCKKPLTNNPTMATAPTGQGNIHLRRLGMFPTVSQWGCKGAY